MKKILIFLCFLSVKLFATEAGSISGYISPSESGTTKSGTTRRELEKCPKPPKTPKRRKKAGEELVLPTVALKNKDNTVAIIPGSFNPPHRGHLRLVTEAMQQSKHIIIVMYSGIRHGISHAVAKSIWEIYLQNLGLSKVGSLQELGAAGTYEIKITDDVTGYATRYYDRYLAAPFQYVVVFHGSDYGYGELEDRYRGAHNLSYEIIDRRAEKSVSATDFVDKLKGCQDINECFKYLPSVLTVEEKKSIVYLLINCL